MCTEATDEGKIYISHGFEDTYDLGLRLGRQASAGELYALYGDLGAGKTAFTQGFAKGLGIGCPVTSPTFIICNTYDEGRIPLYHFDAYRIADPSEMEEIGYDEMFFGEGVTVVEWADMIEELLPEDCVRIHIDRVEGIDLDDRRIVVSGIKDDKG
ncbi:MAG: tRNA (adenosine(37)-N6)-threonylcarbamoyltransferase complex ATPase subunit type 1 TsaE [Lachnospiraceae bacterium]|nr:tRNA (adenosine(37)-N6)-threonylcarbamoyltransferase complex ATPase subunit type 1 TsaE [Lachnospiraceae bacterium]